MTESKSQHREATGNPLKSHSGTKHLKTCLISVLFFFHWGGTGVLDHPLKGQRYGLKFSEASLSVLLIYQKNSFSQIEKLQLSRGGLFYGQDLEAKLKCALFVFNHCLLDLGPFIKISFHKIQ